MKQFFTIILLTLTMQLSQAKILEAKQLFNKKVVTVQSKKVALTKSFYATLEVDESQVRDISLRFSGFVEKLYVTKRYFYVSKNQKLFDIYSDEISSLLKELHQFKQQSTKVRLQNLAINPKEFTKKSAITIYSPYEGFIIKKAINEGSFIPKGKTIFQIANLKRIWAIAKVYQSDISALKKAQKATISVDGIGEFASKIEFIYPQVNSNKTVDVRFSLDNSALRLYPGMFAKATITLQKQSMLTLPKSAVFTKGKKHYVFIVKGDEYEPKEIKAKRVDFNTFSIEGLKEGTKVIDRVMFMLDSDAITNSLYDSDDEDW